MKKIMFLTGTRADYGKMKSLMLALEKSDDFEVYIFVCGMHLYEKFGYTYREVIKDGYKNVYVAFGLNGSQIACDNLGNTVCILGGYVDNIKPDMIVVHGDRMDALAGAVVGILNNILVAHIEGGELSGTMDESIRHAISKFAHIHFVCNEKSKMRLLQMGEEEKRIYIIGSPDIDIMLSENLPSIYETKKRYEIPFEEYGILMYHPVTTEYNMIGRKIRAVVNALEESGENYIVIYPNNDFGSEIIVSEYERIKGNPRFCIFPSIRFEYFLTILKHSKFVIGNSSAGVGETGIYGIPAIDIGTRQNKRYTITASTNIQHIQEDEKQIIDAINQVKLYRKKVFLFGRGQSTKEFLKIVSDKKFWDINIQKQFIDYDFL